MSSNASDVETRSDPAGDGGSALSAGCAWVDGEYLPVAEARIPLLDTGFLRSDLTYDVVGVWDGKFFRLDDHLDRLERGCRAIRLESPLSRARVREILLEIVARSGIRHAYVSMTVTRGVPPRGVRDPRAASPRFYAYAVPYVWILPPEKQGIGASIVLARTVRRIPPDAIDPTVKNYMWGDFMRGQFEAFDRGGELAVLTDGDDNVTEGGGFNVFAAARGMLRTPAAGVLRGITRETVLEIAAEEGLETEVGSLPADALRDADEAFITSTAGGVMAVSSIDGDPIGDGRPGPITRRIRDRYWDWHADPRFTTDVEYRT